MSERPIIAATYEQRCPWCDESIFEDDLIALSEPDGEWMHRDCAEEVGEWEGE